MVKDADSDTYVFLLRRLLEIFCDYKSAKGNNLYSKLKHLGNKGEIPSQLAAIAHSLRKYSNIKDHDDDADLSDDHIPVIDRLDRALIEYLYEGPKFVEIAEKQLAKFNRKSEEDEGE